MQKLYLAVNINFAKAVGFQGECIIYKGPCKGEEVYEACRLGALPQMLGRVNFNLEKYVPEQKSTGTEAERFGICYENGDLERALEYLKK